MGMTTKMASKGAKTTKTFELKHGYILRLSKIGNITKTDRLTPPSLSSIELHSRATYGT